MSPVAAPVRVGLIGFGLAGASFHRPLIAAEPRLALAAVASTREAVAELAPAARRHETPAALIADPAIDCVVIATPNESHAPLARAALAAGRHVVVDKPFVIDPGEGAALVAQARAAGQVLTVFHNRRWDGDFLTVADLVATGALGAVGLAEFHWDRFRPAIKPGWRELAGAGSGLMADLAPHMVDQAIALFGLPETVRGDVAIQRAEAATDDYFEILLGYGAMRVRIAAASLVARPRPRFALHGTLGSFVKYGIDPQEDQLRGGMRADDPAFGVEPVQRHGTLYRAGADPVVMPTRRGEWRRFYAGVAAAILDGAPVPVPPGDALDGLDIIARARG